MNPPKRAFEVQIHIGADSAKDLTSAIEQILYAFEESKGPRAIASGSPSAGWYTEVQIDPSITHEQYIVDLHKYLEESRKAKQAEVVS